MTFKSFTTALLAAVTASMMVLGPSAFAKGKETILEFTQGETLSVDAFDGLALTGGGKVTVSYGEGYLVTVVNGAEQTELVLKQGSLKIRCPKKKCRGKMTREIEVVVPTLEDVAVVGGGLMKIGEGFAPRAALNAAVVGGGQLDAANLSARDVSAAVTGGGKLLVSADEALSAAVVGGGSISYSGDAKVTKSTIGGGSVRRRE